MSFADNSSTNSSALYDHLVVYSGKTSAVIVNSLTSFSVVLFPFYAYLNIINRPQDSQRAVFPFLDFFFKIMCFTVVGYAYATIYFAVLVIKGITDPSYAFLETPLFQFGGLLFYFIFIATVINMPVCQLLTSILAFHRFLLHCFPRIGDFFTPGKKAIHILTCMLYSVVVVARVSWLCITEEVWMELSILHLYSIGVDLSELLISLPYTFMILSIRKLTHLASAIQSRPEKYIAYQIIIGLVLKLVSLLFAFTISYLSEKDLASSIKLFIAIDLLKFPIVIQLAYILSNKKNVDSLIKLITGKVMFWKNRARVGVETSTRF